MPNKIIRKNNNVLFDHIFNPFDANLYLLWSKTFLT